MVEQIITPDAVEVYDRASGPILSPVQEAMSLFARLPPILKGFLLTLARDRLDEVSILAFADWLEENGCAAEGQRVRLLRPQEGDVLVLWVGSLCAAPRRAALAGVALPPGVAAVALYEDERLEAIDPEQLRAAGWVRADQAERYARERERAEREACARVVEVNVYFRDPSVTDNLARRIRARGDSE